MKLFHFIFGATAWILSKVPMRLLYLKSDCIAFILNHIVRYRRKVALQNLRNSFPEKSGKELKKILMKYYRNISDIIMEVIKTPGLSREKLTERMTFTNYDLLKKYTGQGRSVLLITAHMGNWEWLGNRMSLDLDFLTCAIVKPLSDPWFDNFMAKRRLHFKNAHKIDFRYALKDMLKVKDTLNVTIIAGDQTPTKNEINFWIDFLNQETPVYLGVEKIAKLFDRPVIYTDIQRKKRGHYEVSFTLITDNPKSTADEEITTKHVRLLEESIRKHPDNWLWSHRRWKHSKFEN